LAVWLAAFAAFSFYAAAVPLKFALVVHICARPGFGAAASPFENRFALRSALLRARGEKKPLPWKKAEIDLEKSCVLPAAWAAGRYLLRHARLEKLHARGRVSTGDAARTALICGCANALEAALSPFAAAEAVQLRLEPDFSAGHSDVQLCGMISVRLGHIICAALIGAYQYASRRIKHGKASD